MRQRPKQIPPAPVTGGVRWSPRDLAMTEPALSERTVSTLTMTALTMTALTMTTLTAVGCGTPVAPGGGGKTGPKITVTVTSPVKDDFLSDFVVITGTIEGGANQVTKLIVKGKDSCKLAETSPLATASKTTDLNELEKFARRYFIPFKDIKAEQGAIQASLASKLKILTDNCQATGTTFSFPFASQQHDAKDKPLFKDGKLTVSVSVSADGDARGSGSVGVNIDNAVPTVEILEPKNGSAHIRKVTVRGRVTEKNLGDVALFVSGAFPGQAVRRLFKCSTKAPPDDDFNCKKCEEINKPLGGACMSKGGNFKFEIDRGSLPTSDVTLTLIAQDGVPGEKDGTKRQKTVESTIKMLRPPLYDVAYVRDDPAIKSVADYRLFDYTGDGVLDLVLCSSAGVFVRDARVVKDSSPPRGSGEWHPANKLSAMPCVALELADVDPHACAGEPETRAGDLKDIIALGSGDSGGSELQYFLARKGDSPRLIQALKINSSATALAVGQMDGSGPLDVVVGSTEDEYALATFLSLENAKCPTQKEPKRLCRDAVELKGTSKGAVTSAPSFHKMLGKISSIAIDDFYQLDNEGLPDVVVGREVPIVTVCPNAGKGQYLACVDTGTTGALAALSDSYTVISYDWTKLNGKGTGVPDLIVSSKGLGGVRWLQGLGNGSFKFDPVTAQVGPGQFIGSANHQLSLVNVGVLPETDPVLDRCGAQVDIPNDPRGKLYLALARPKSPTFLDLNGSNAWFQRTCDHSWILGDKVEKMLSGDVDNDGIMDLTAMNNGERAGITVAIGVNPYLTPADKKNKKPTHNGVMRFHAAEVFRVCGRTGGLYAPVEVGKFVVGTTDGDNNPDLVIGSNGTESAKHSCDVDDAEPAHMFHIYRNTGTTGLELDARAMEYAPYRSQELTKSGATKAGCGLAFGKLVGLELANLNGSGPLDLVFATQIVYTHGKTPDIVGYFTNFDSDTLPKSTSDELNLIPNPDCYCQEHYEIHNLFSEDSEDAANCRVYTSINMADLSDLDPPQQVTGYGNNGAPVERASLMYLLNNGSGTDPFGLTNVFSPATPKVMTPTYAQSGGREIQDLAIIDIDGDGDDDVATVMAASGNAGEMCHLAPRVRIFETAIEGGLVAKPVMHTTEGSFLEQKLLTKHFKNANPIRVIAMDKDSLSYFNPVDGDKTLPPNYVSYRTVSPQPFDIIAKQFCQVQTKYRLDPNKNPISKNLETLFVLGKQEHDFCMLRPQAHQYPGGIGGSTVWSRPYFTHKTCNSLGNGLQGFSVQDVYGDGGQDQCADVIFAKASGMYGMAGGEKSFGGQTKIFATNSTRSAIDTLDVNQDGFLDVLALDSDTDSVQIVLGDGKGKFVEEKRRIASTTLSSTMRIADFDLDNCMDLVVQGEFGVAVYRNLSCD
jgi:hypothetical protein